MSFAGPKDSFARGALKAAYDKGILLIAAAGNAGPRRPRVAGREIPSRRLDGPAAIIFLYTSSDYQESDETHGSST
jgi:hypothetical protein